MTWPFDKPENKVTPEEKPEQKPEKTPAELIAEAIQSNLKPVMDRFDAQDQRFAKLEEQTKPREPKTPENTEGPVSVLDDENLAFAQRMTPIFARTLELESRIVRDEIRVEYEKAGYGDLWAEFSGEINSVLDNAPLATNDGKPFRGDPQYIRNVVDMILGRAARKGGMRFDGKSKGFFLEAAGGSSDASRGSESDGLTDAQRKVMARMGVPTEKAKEVIKKLHFVQ